MEKEFKSIVDLGFSCGEYFSKDNGEYHKHLDLNFIGVYGNDIDGYETAYCDSVTGEIFIQDIYELTEDGIYEKLEIDDLVFWKQVKKRTRTVQSLGSLFPPGGSVF